jgi:predicted GNAT family N-acyltransferase
MGKIKAPEKINASHELHEFDCGQESLNDWLKKKALKNQEKYSTTTVVSVDNKVIAYYTLAFGSVNREEMSRKLRQNAPERIPMMILGRLAVDKVWQGQRIAKHLLKEALSKTLQASQIAAVRGILVHALDEKAEHFYKRYGFLNCQTDLTLLLPLEDIHAQLSLVK